MNFKDLSCCNQQLDSGLHSAVRRRDSHSIQRVLVSGAAGAAGSVNTLDEAGKSALHVAVQENYLQAVQLLLRGDADTSLQDHQGNTPLHYACAETVTPSIVEELLVVMETVSVTSQNASGVTALMSASQNGNTDAVALLLAQPDAKVALNFVNNLRQTALHLATLGCHGDVVRLLIRQGANVNRRDCAEKSKGETPLHAAVRNEDGATARVLIASGADPGAINTYGETCLYMAAKTGSVELVKLLLGNHGDQETEDATGSPVRSERPRMRDGVKDALIVAIRMGHEGVVRTLLRHFVGLDLKSALLAASMAGNEAIMTSLLTHLRPEDLQFSECVDCCCQSLAQHAVILATRFGHLGVLNLLAEVGGCPVDIKFSCSRTLLHEAALHGHQQIAQYILNTGVKINARDYFGRTPLMDAVCSNKVEIIDAIVAFTEGAGTRQRRSSLDQSTLGISTFTGNCTRRHRRFKNSKTIELLNALDYSGNTYMHMAASRGHLDVIKYLTSCGVPDVNARDAHLATPLHSAVQGRRQDVAQCLIHSGAFLDPEDHAGVTPLVLAIRNVDLPMGALLLNSGADVTKIRSSLQPPVTYGLVLAQPALIAILIAAGALQSDIQYLTSGYQELIEDSTVSTFLAQKPLTLKFLSRITIRKSLRTDMTVKTTELPLPPLLKNFILLQEFL